MTNPAEDKARLEMVLGALRRISKGGEFTRIDCFDDDRFVATQRRVLEELIRKGVISKLPGVSPAHQVKYKLDSMDALKHIMGDRVRVSSLIWTTDSVVPEELLEVEPESPQEPEQEASEPLDETQAALMKMAEMFEKAMVSMVYMRDKIEAMEAKVNRLYSDLTGEK